MKIINKKAKYNYRLFDRFEAGISLTGPEVKAIKMASVDLSHSYAKIIDSEIFLINLNISTGGVEKSNRTRKLLLHKNQIVGIKTKMKAKKLTLVPTKLYNKGRLVKVEMALAKVKRKFEKKEALKRRDIEREIEKELRGK